MKADLREAMLECSSRGLVQSAKWLGEQMVGYTGPDSRKKLNLEITWVTKDDYDLYLLAKTYFDLKEYLRCAWFLRNSRSKKSVFLWCYSTFLAGERMKNQKRGNVFSETDVVHQNEELSRILQRIEQEQDPWILYVKGVCLFESEQVSEAREALVQSINLYPLNWSAWLQLVKCIGSRNIFCHTKLRLPDCFLKHFFVIHCLIHLKVVLTEESQASMSFLESLFEKSTSVLALSARKLSEENECSLQKWDSLLNLDPYRLDEVDVYAHLLFVKDHHVHLAHLAHKASKIDPNRPETCLTIGNLFACRNQHQKAVEYFKKALFFNRNDGNSWVLLGHAYLELKNIEAATESYVRAVDLNHYDHRALFALGNIYDLLDQHNLAVDYFQQVLVVRPLDGRIWSCLAMSYRKLKRYQDALYAAKRTWSGDFLDPNMYCLVAEMYQMHEINGDPYEWFLRAWESKDEGSLDLDQESKGKMCSFLAKRAYDQVVHRLKSGDLIPQQEAMAEYTKYLNYGRDIPMIKALSTEMDFAISELINLT